MKTNPQDIISAALVSILTKEKAKAALQPGAHGFVGDVTFHLDCQIVKGESESYVPTTSLPTKNVLACALALAKVPKKRITDLIVEAVHEAMTGEYSDKVAEYIEHTDAAMDAVQAMLEKLPEKTREGKTTVTGTAELIGVKEAS